MRFKLRLFPRFLLLLTALTVLPVALASHFLIQLNSRQLQFEVQRYHLLLAKSLADKLDERLSALQSQVPLAISSFQNPDFGWAERNTLLSTIVDSSPHFGIISAVSSNGEELMKVYNPVVAPEVEKNPSLLDHSLNPSFKKMKKSNQVQMEVKSTPTLLYTEIYVPFRTYSGMNSIYIKASLNDIRELIDNEPINQTGFAYFVNHEGTIMTHPQSAYFEPNVAMDTSLVDAALNGSEAAREFTDNKGTEWVSASAPISKLGGAIITQQTRNEAYEASIRAFKQALVAVFITLLLAITGAYFLARSLVQPLLQIARFAQAVDLGKNLFPEKLHMTSNDEVGDVAATFNSMMEKLKGYASLQVEKLLVEQKKTEAIIFSIEDGIIMTDYQGKIQLMNYKAKRVLKIPDNQAVVGEALWRFLPSSELKTAFIALLTQTDETKGIEVKIQNDNKDRFYNLTSEQVRTPNRTESLGIVTVLHDKTLEKELDSMKEEFLHSITHDLRNPLTAVRGFIRLFLSGQPGPITDLQKKMLETMDKASLRLVTMVNDILDLARLDAGRLTLQLDECKIVETAGRVIDLFSPQAKGHNIELKQEVKGEAANVFIADVNLIERIFTNLIANALKFTPDNGTITVKINYRTEDVHVSVTDTGEGIPADYLIKVFDKFRQVEGNYKGGAGLGLTICKRIVEAHSGRIWAESEPGKGASFQFSIPLNLSRSQRDKAA